MDDPRNPLNPRNPRDPRIEQALDTIADLFLTDPLPPSTPQPSRRPEPDQSHEPAGSPPFRLSPKLRATAASAVAATLNSPRSAAAAPAAPIGAFKRWRQGSPSGATPFVHRPIRHTPTIHPAVRVEAVFLGNLPGFGAPWLTQFAQQLASAAPDEDTSGSSETSGGGGVGILHVDDSRIDLELVRPMGRHSPVARPATADLLDTLAHLTHDTQPPVARWLVHLPMPLTAGALTMARDLDDWTILCGSDDAAIVAAYGWLKQMLDADPRRESRRLSVAIMGSDPDRAAAALGKLREAAGGFLRHSIELAASQKQMAPVNLQGMGSYDDAQALWPQVAAMLHSLADEEEFEHAPADDPTAYVFPAATAAPPPAPAATAPPRHAAPAAEPAAPQAPSVAPAAPVPAEAASAAPAEVASTEPVEVASTEPVEVNLAAFLTDIGGVALAARCPRQPSTQLLLDQDGRLHLLRRHTQAPAHHAPQTETSGGLRDAVIDLLEARAWVREHIDLLRLTQRQCRFDLAADPALHLFTDQARLAVALAAKLGPALHLHLLQQVRVGQASTWVSTPLN